MARPQLKEGQLVQVLPLPEPAAVPKEWQGDGRKSGAPVDVSGEHGQVVEWDEEQEKWMVATFSAKMVSLGEAQLRALRTEELEGLDIVLGPASDPQVMGTELVDWLARQGYARCKIFIGPEDLKEINGVAQRCLDEGRFSRLPLELEPSYLGRHGCGKTMSVFAGDEDGDLPSYVRDSALSTAEMAIETVGTLLRPLAEPELGFDVYSRSSTTLSLPFAGDEADFDAPDLENEEAANFLSMMWRAKLMVILNVGPGTGKLTLLPKLEGESETTLALQPGMLTVIATDRFRFAYEPDGNSLALSCWYLDAPTDYVVSNIEGDITGWEGGGVKPGLPPPRHQAEHITTCGMGERYAFGIDQPWKLWCAYAKTCWDAFIEFPFKRWDVDIYYSPDPDLAALRGQSYTRHGGFSDGIELFDNRFFDISTGEAKGMDPTQRQVLEVAYLALLHGGWDKKYLQTKPANIASWVGIDKNEWGGMPKEIDGGFVAVSSANAITSNRFNYCLNLKGASMTIDTACSASLVCLHTAKTYLKNTAWDRLEAAIVTGVNLLLTPGSFIGCCGANMISHIGRCFTYNFSADGYARGESTASVCLKLKPWNPDEGDFALVAGSQCNQDGRSASLTAPNGPAQERCTRTVLDEAKLQPPEVDVCECHGTGTALGDPIEIGAYKRVMTERGTIREEPVVLTSGKSNIGHCEGSAGVGGFLRAALMCMYNEAMPNVHLNKMNPHISHEGFPCIFLSENVVNRFNTSYNGCLSFGFGGTNAVAQVYSRNLMTSRGSSSKDLHLWLTRKLAEAPSQQVTVTGDEWEEWDMPGPEKDPKFGERWSIYLDEDGHIEYLRDERERVELDPDAVLYLSGSFNDWDHEVMVEDEDMQGCFWSSFQIGEDLEERFQVVVDADSSKIFHPGFERCSRKSANVLGPEEAPREKCWCVQGGEGDIIRVEFNLTEAGTVSINWMTVAFGGEEGGSEIGAGEEGEDADLMGAGEDDGDGRVDWEGEEGFEGPG